MVGFTAIETSVAGLTFSGAEPFTPFSVAEMFAVPVATPVAVPFVANTVATAVLSELHVASFVTNWEVPSLKDPVAEKFCFVPAAIVRPEGITVIDTTFAFVTVKGAEADTDPSVAVIVTSPGATPFARPVVAPIVATVVSDELHVA